MLSQHIRRMAEESHEKQNNCLPGWELNMAQRNTKWVCQPWDRDIRIASFTLHTHHYRPKIALRWIRANVIYHRHKINILHVCRHARSTSSNIYICIYTVSSVSTVTSYSLGGRSSIPRRGGGYFTHPLRPAVSGAHPASRTMGAGGSLQAGNMRPGRDADHSALSRAEAKKERGCTCCHPYAPVRTVTGSLVHPLCPGAPVVAYRELMHACISHVL
jgi:hypothetical protein